MSRTITIDDETFELPPYEIGDRVEVHTSLRGGGVGWHPATVVGIDVTNDAPVRCWLSAGSIYDTAKKVWTFELVAVRHRSAIDRLAELA